MSLLTNKPAQTPEQWEQVRIILNGNVEFGDTQSGPINIRGAWYSGTTPAGADTEFTVAHHLGRIPSGEIVVSVNKAGVIYKGTTPWTTTDIYLKCNVGSVAVVLFVF